MIFLYSVWFYVLNVYVHARSFATLAPVNSDIFTPIIDNWLLSQIFQLPGFAQKTVS